MAIERVALLAVLLLAGCSAAPPRPPAGMAPRLGQPATPAQIAALDPTVFPDGRGLPPGQGTVAQGQALFAARCAACHGADGRGGPGGPLVGREPLAASPRPAKTIGQYWPHATTVFDYIRRAMPLDAPGTLGNGEVYALTAWLLAANGVVANDAVLDATTLPAVRMPNRDGFVPAPGTPR